MTKSLYVSEIFGPTFQGEGPSMGQRAFFIRLAGCNLTCEWCDAAYTWDWKRFPKEVEKLSCEEVYSRLVALGYNEYESLLVISGGEPMLQQDALADLLGTFNFYPRAEIETNGTVRLRALLPLLYKKITFNVSPKLAHSGKATQIDPTYIDSMYITKCVFKFVCKSITDLEEVEAYNLPRDKVWIMPEGITPTGISKTSRALAEEVLKRGWNLTTRLQILLWEAERAH